MSKMFYIFRTNWHAAYLKVKQKMWWTQVRTILNERSTRVESKINRSHVTSCLFLLPVILMSASICSFLQMPIDRLLSFANIAISTISEPIFLRPMQINQNFQWNWWAFERMITLLEVADEFKDSSFIANCNCWVIIIQ